MNEEPGLPDDVLARRREHLMTTIDTTPTTARSRRWPIAAAAIAAVLAGGGAVAATAGSPAVTRQPNGTVAIDTSSLQPSYRGHLVTPAELDALHREGKATASLENREAACQGVYLLFDSSQESDAFEDAYLATRRATPTSPTSDPCAKTPDTPDFTAKP